MKFIVMGGLGPSQVLNKSRSPQKPTPDLHLLDHLQAVRVLAADLREHVPAPGQVLAADLEHNVEQPDSLNGGVEPLDRSIGCVSVERIQR